MTHLAVGSSADARPRQLDDAEELEPPNFTNGFTWKAVTLLRNPDLAPEGMRRFVRGRFRERSNRGKARSDATIQGVARRVFVGTSSRSDDAQVRIHFTVEAEISNV